MTDNQRRAQEPTAPPGWPRHETEIERKHRINREIIRALLDCGFTFFEAIAIVDTVEAGLIPRLSIDYSFGDDDK